MRCENARRIISLSGCPEIASPELIEARRHVEECRECETFIDGERAFVSLLRSAVKKEVMPERLKERILKVSGEEKKRSLKSVYRWPLIAASILLFVVSGYTFFLNIKSPPVFESIVSDYAKYLSLTELEMRSSNKEDIKRWFAGKVDFPVDLPVINATLEGARLCKIKKKLLALLFYKYKNTPLSLFIAGEFDHIKIGKEVKLKGRTVYVKHEDDYLTIMWEEKGLGYALVSSLPINEVNNIF